MEFDDFPTPISSQSPDSKIDELFHNKYKRYYLLINVWNNRLYR